MLLRGGNYHTTRKWESRKLGRPVYYTLLFSHDWCVSNFLDKFSQNDNELVEKRHDYLPGRLEVSFRIGFS